LLIKSSPLGKKIRRVGDILTKTTISRINDYEDRFSKVSKWYGSLLKDVIVDRHDKFETY